MSDASGRGIPSVDLHGLKGVLEAPPGLSLTLENVPAPIISEFSAGYRGWNLLKLGGGCGGTSSDDDDNGEILRLMGPKKAAAASKKRARPPPAKHEGAPPGGPAASSDRPPKPKAARGNQGKDKASRLRAEKGIKKEE